MLFYSRKCFFSEILLFYPESLGVVVFQSAAYGFAAAKSQGGVAHAQQNRGVALQILRNVDLLSREIARNSLVIGIQDNLR